LHLELQRPFITKLNARKRLQEAQLRFFLCDKTLWIQTHHIAVDGLGLKLLKDQVEHALQTEQTAKSSAYYTMREYAKLEAAMTDDKTVTEFWRKSLSSIDCSRLKILPQYCLQSEYSGSVAGHEMVLSFDLKKSVQNFYTLALTAFCRVIEKISGRTSLVIGCLYNGRWRPEMTEIVGLFSQTVPLPLKTASSLAEVQEIFNNCITHARQMPDVQYSCDVIFTSDDGMQSSDDKEDLLVAINRMLYISVYDRSFYAKWDPQCFSRQQMKAIFEMWQEELEKIGI